MSNSEELAVPDYYLAIMDQDMSERALISGEMGTQSWDERKRAFEGDPISGCCW